ncbi:LysR family transcriptional regulator [Rhodovastum atsumiense]|uniref:LysR family transcriptional regulator n=1 Tax=Rhodovastum atsumiense TaxID=504468 RepID=A0A5M6IL87_9PROT|nr:LysR family transcriptional regulator [Rhodovastum atsumiense]KAA5609004.1 LysR family transcriptional regulator [Rhodovastum atsumiense]CAH2599080.1 LysR family transcriptional regulator [Rhodovastum atsumiense]
MRINITPQQLAAFLRVAETLSFSEAATQLAVSQPALSRTIRLMEETLGARLLDRDTRNVTLTPAGQELRPIALRIVREFESSFSELSRFVTGQRGRVVIATLPSMAAVLLPGTIAHFRETRPDVDFQILDAHSGQVHDSVADGLAEIGLTAQPSPDRQLVYHPLLTDEFGLVCRKDDPLAEGGAVPWSIFGNRSFIAMSKGSSVRASTDAAFLQARLPVAPLFECSFLATARALVNARLGITALPGLTVPLMAESGLVWRRLIDPVLCRSLGVVHRAGATLAPATLDFIAHLRQEVRRRSAAVHEEGAVRPVEETAGSPPW